MQHLGLKLRVSGLGLKVWGLGFTVGGPFGGLGSQLIGS